LPTTTKASSAATTKANPTPAAANPTPAAANPTPAAANPTPAATNPTPAATNPTPAATNPTPAAANPTPAATNPTPAAANPTPVAANPTPTPRSSQTTVIDDSIQGTGSNQFHYVGGGWQHVTNYCQGNPCEYNNGNSWNSTANDYVTITFTGVQLRFYGVIDPKHGIGAASIDRSSETMIDFYAANRAGNQLLWTSPMLPAGTHTFKLRVTGNKNPKSSNTYTIVDRVDILS
jgi:hypothetical protein